MRVALVVVFIVAGTIVLAGCAGNSVGSFGAGSFGTDRAAPTIADLPSSNTQTAEAAAIVDASYKAIAGYRDFLARYPDSPYRQGILRRMADLLVDVSEAEALAEALAPTAVSGKGESKGNASNATAHRFDEPIAIYQGLLISATPSSDNAETLYQLARAQQNNGQSLQALETMERLITEYPAVESSGGDNRLYADTQFRRAELFFAARGFVRAGETYADVVALGETVPVYQQSLYKLGWSLFKQQRYQDALVPFSQILDRQLARSSDTNKNAPTAAAPLTLFDALSRAEREQVTDVLRGISLSFSYLAGPSSVTEFFDLHGKRRYEVLIYTNLAALYQRNELPTDAAHTWLALAARDPNGAMAPNAYIEAIKLYQQAGSSQLMWQTRADFARYYRWDRDYWVTHSANSSTELVDELQHTLTLLSGHHHRRAVASGEAEDSQQAETWYRQYLAQFSSSDAVAEINYQLAELLYQRGDYQRAANEYERSAYGRGDHQWAEKSGRSALQAYQRLFEELEGQAEDSSVARQSAIAGLSERRNRSRIRFVQTFPDHSDAALILTQTGYELLQQGEADTVVGLSEALSQRGQRGASKPTSQLSSKLSPELPLELQQANRILWAQAQFERGQFKAAEQGYRQALLKTQTDRSQYLALQQGIAVSLYRQAQLALQSGAQRQAATLFLEAAAAPGFANVSAGTHANSNDSSNDSAQENSDDAYSMMPIDAQLQAAALLLGLAEWDEAVRVLERLRASNPRPGLDSQRQLSLTKKLAFGYQRSGRYAKAATEYQRLGLGKVGDGEQPDLRRQALLRSAELFLQAGQAAAATTSLEAYVELFAEPVGEATRAMLQLADLSHSAGNVKTQRRWLAQIVKVDGTAGDDISEVVAANAALQLADQPRLQFEQVLLVEPLQQSLTKKLAVMEQALAALASASVYGVAAVSNAARYREAAIYHQLHQSLLESERPAGLNSEETTQYNQLLATQAKPFKQKAILLYQGQIRRTSADPLDKWTQLSLAALTKLSPQQYAKPERSDPWWRSAQTEPANCIEVSRWHGCTVNDRSGHLPELRQESRSESLPRTFREMSVQISKQHFAEAEALLATSAEQGQYADLLLDYIGDSALRGDFEGANMLLQWLPELDAGKSIAYTQLGIQLRQAGYLSRARKAYQRALEVKPDYPLAHLNLGILCDLYLQATECAMDHYGAFQRLSAEADPQVNRWLENLQ